MLIHRAIDPLVAESYVIKPSHGLNLRGWNTAYREETEKKVKKEEKSRITAHEGNERICSPDKMHVGAQKSTTQRCLKMETRKATKNERSRIPEAQESHCFDHNDYQKKALLYLHAHNEIFKMPQENQQIYTTL